MTHDFKDDKVATEYADHQYGATKEINQASDSSVDLESLDVDEKRLMRKM